MIGFGQTRPALVWAAVALGSVATASHPALIGPLAVAAGVLLVRRTVKGRRRGGGTVALAELTSLGLSAGLSFPGALAAARPHIAPSVSAEVSRVLRTGRRDGLAYALERADGVAAPLYRIAGRAIRTGAPLRAAVQAHVADHRAEERSRALARARRLPVKLLFPLSLLILPGFLVLTVGPTLLGAFERLRL